MRIFTVRSNIAALLLRCVYTDNSRWTTRDLAQFNGAGRRPALIPRRRGQRCRENLARIRTAMQPLHPLLERQLKQHVNDDPLPQWMPLLHAISKVYVDFDEDRYVSDCSL